MVQEGVSGVVGTQKRKKKPHRQENMEQTLPVEDVHDEQLQEWERKWDAGEPAETAQEYIFRVRLEAQALPDVVEVEKGEEEEGQGWEENGDCGTYMPQLEPVCPCAPPLVPSEQWERQILGDFEDLRLYLDYLKELGVGSKESGHRIAVPALKDEMGWHIVCFGGAGRSVVTHIEAIASDTIQIGEGGLGGEVEEEARELYGDAWLPKYPRGNKPTVEVLLQFDQVLVKKLLAYNAEWLQRALLSKARAAWVYALLARLSKPVSAGVIRILSHLVFSFSTDPATRSHWKLLAWDKHCFGY
jgi:hypothetical protein